MEERFWLLVSLKFSGETTPEEEEEMAELLRLHPDWGLRMELFGKVWAQHAAPAKDGAVAYNKHLQRLSNHLAAPTLQYEQPVPARTNTRLFRWPALAVAASLLCIFTFLYLYKHHHNDEAANTVSTRPGSRSRLQLPDGTQVWLNADSRLAYQFTGARREVLLTGEAYFDVAKDKDHPFLIHTSTVDIRVLGTAFNVRSYTNEKHTETALFQGAVEITLQASPDKKIILRPNEKLTVRNNDMTVSGGRTQRNDDGSDEPLMTLGKVHFQQKDSSCTETLWTRNQLAFDNSSLEEVALQLERWYGVKVTIKDEKMKNYRFSGVFKDEALAQVMEALQLTGSFNYTILRKEVIITP